MITINKSHKRVVINTSSKSILPTKVINRVVIKNGDVIKYEKVTNRVVIQDAKVIVKTEPQLRIIRVGIQGIAGVDGQNGILNWSVDGAYSINDIVNYEGQLYINLTGNNTHAPDAGDTDWEVYKQKDFRLKVKNLSGATIAKGKVVYISGATGGNPEITLADNTTEITSSKTFGVIENDITNNEVGYIVTMGELDHIDLSAFTDGDDLWLSTNGNLTATIPVSPAHAVFIGYALTATNNGKLLVRIQNGYELEELHNVLIDNIQNNQILQWDSTTGLWKNQNPPTSAVWGGITGTLSNQTDLQSALENKSNITHNHNLSSLLDVNSSAKASNRVLQWNGTQHVYVDLPSGGGTPAGATGNIQFNNGGAFGASTNLNWNNTNNTFSIAAKSGQSSNLIEWFAPDGTQTGYLNSDGSHLYVGYPNSNSYEGIIEVQGRSKSTLRIAAVNQWTVWEISTGINQGLTFEGIASTPSRLGDGFIFKNADFTVEDVTGLKKFQFKYTGFNPVRLGMEPLGNPWANFKAEILYQWSGGRLYREFILDRFGMMYWHAANFENLDSTVTPMTIKGAISQSATLLSLQDSTGTVQSSFSPEGHLGIQATPASNVPLIVNNVGLTSDCLRIQRNGTTYAYMDRFGSWLYGTASASAGFHVRLNDTPSKITAGTGTGYAMALRGIGNSGYGTLYLQHIGATVSTYALQVEQGSTQMFSIRGNKQIIVGTGDPMAHFHIKGKADEVQQIIQANSAQNFNLQEWQDSSGSAQSYVDNSGNFVMRSLPTSDPLVAGKLWNDSGTLKVSAG